MKSQQSGVLENDEQAPPTLIPGRADDVFEHVQKRLRGHIPAIDGIRGCAILMVMIFHFGAVLAPKGSVGAAYYAFKSFGWSGVDLFFVLSGFLITGILLESKGNEGYFKSFYMRRILRIFPLYYSILFVDFVLLALSPAARHLALRDGTRLSIQWWYVFYVQNWITAPLQPLRSLEHFWSLAIEEQFYLVWPMLVFLASRRTLARICVALTLLSVVARIGMYQSGSAIWAAYSFTITRLDGLALGALLAIAVRDPDGFRGLRRFSPAIAIAAALLLAAMGLHYGSLDWYPWPMLIAAPLLASILYVRGLAKIVMGLGTATLGQVVTNNKALRSIGKYSYAMYALHGPIHKVVHYFAGGLEQRVEARGGVSWIGFTVLYTLLLSAITYGLARVSWWALESRFLMLKAHFKPTPRSSTVTVLE